MKIFLGVFTAFAVAVPGVSATSGPVANQRTTDQPTAFTSEYASEDACFGQARSFYGREYAQNTPWSNGTFIHNRKGDNPEQNDQYTADNCVVGEDDE